MVAKVTIITSTSGSSTLCGEYRLLLLLLLLLIMVMTMMITGLYLSGVGVYPLREMVHH